MDRPAMTRFHTDKISRLIALVPFVLVACGGPGDVLFAQNNLFTTTVVADFDEPWAMAFLPDGRLLVSEKRGALKLYTTDRETLTIAGIPEVE